MSIKVVYEGVEYPSKVAFAVAMGFDKRYATVVYDYLIRGKKYVGKGVNRDKIFVKDGVEYRSITDYAKKNNLTYLKAKQIITGVVKQKTTRYNVVCFGRTYDSMMHLASEYGVGYWIVKDRVKRGMSLEDAVSLPVKKKTEYSFNGVTYHSLKELSSASGVNYSTLKRRLSLGLTGNKLTSPVKEIATKDTVGDVYPELAKYIKDGLIHYNGETYENLSRLCIEYQANQTTLTRNLNRGASLDDMLCKKTKTYIRVWDRKRKRVVEKSKEPLINIDGVDYYTKTSIADKIGVSKYVLLNRLKRGFTLEQSVDPNFNLKHKKKKKKKTVESLIKADRSVKIKFLNYHLNKGVPLDKAVKLAAKASKPKLIYNNKEYVSVSSLARELKVSPHNLNYYLNRGLSVYEAVYRMSNPVKEKISYGGKEYETLTALAKDLDLNVNNLMYRLKKGVALSDAVDIVKTPKTSKVTYNGVEYDTLASLARELDLRVSKLRSSLKEGFSLEESVNLAQKPKGVFID